VLRVTFEQNPGGATFSMFQRFIRRNLGITAARRVFSETHAMRQANAKLALEVCISHFSITRFVGADGNDFLLAKPEFLVLLVSFFCSYF
jgi:hypothetical protein